MVKSNRNTKIKQKKLSLCGGKTVSIRISLHVKTELIQKLRNPLRNKPIWGKNHMALRSNNKVWFLSSVNVFYHSNKKIESNNRYKILIKVHI